MKLKITPEIKKIYNKIQMQVYNMIPEKWSEVYLYSSVIEQVRRMQTGEMFFYYYPKSIIKKKCINVYEIPGLFKLDEEDYDVLVNRLYSYIKELRRQCMKMDGPIWTNLTIHIKQGHFLVDYNYEDILNSKITDFERHVLWKYKYLKQYSQYNSKEAAVIKHYLREEETIKSTAHTKPDYMSDDMHAIRAKKIYTPLAVNNTVEVSSISNGSIYREKPVNVSASSILNTSMMGTAVMTNPAYGRIRANYIQEEQPTYERQPMSRQMSANQILTSSVVSRQEPTMQRQAYQRQSEQRNNRQLKNSRFM